MKTNLEELQSFVTIVDRGSLSAAAEELGQSSSGLSRSLSRLEQKLGVTLLRRTTRRLDLSQEGIEFLKRAREILKQVEEAEIAVQQADSAPSGLLRIDSASPFIFHQVVPVVAEFTELYPKVKIEIFNNERTIDLIEKRIDLAIRIGKLEDSSLNAVSLGASRRRIFASPQYLKKYGTPKRIEDLEDHKLVGFSEPRHLNLWPLKIEGEGLYVANPSIAASSGETLLHLAEAGAGIVCLSDFMTKLSRINGKLVELFPAEVLDNREQIHGVYYKNLQGSKSLKLFLQLLKQRLKEKL